MEKISVTIMGAGLAGCLLAIYLARRGYTVTLYESREDPRLEAQDQGRSINLALSCRGLTSLRAAGLDTIVQDYMVPMRARAIHAVDGTVQSQPFGRSQDEYINAIVRNDLQKLLLDAMATYPAICCHFQMRLHQVDFLEKKLFFENGEVMPYVRLVGADGAGSIVREALAAHQHITAQRTFFDHGYKEISISSAYAEHLASEHLHLWPRHSFLLLGNPNRDHSVTGSLFLPHQGENSFQSLQEDAQIETFFAQAFPDAYPLMPDLLTAFHAHPVGNMSNIFCAPWYFEDHCMLIGDAAHGIVPFFGQGMNAAFEDCRIFNQILDHCHDDWLQALPAFYTARKSNTDAVAALSMENYQEIYTDICSEKFIAKKRFERALMERYGDRYVSKHVLVMFTNTPYAAALEHGHIQESFMKTLVDSAVQGDTIDWSIVDQHMALYEKSIRASGIGQ